MKLFVDTSAWVALNDLTDQHHAVAVEKFARIRSKKGRVAYERLYPVQKV